MRTYCPKSINDFGQSLNKARTRLCDRRGGVQKNFNHRLKKYLRKDIGRFSQTSPLHPVIAGIERFGETTWAFFVLQME
jgi:hypothetical protein